jgi:hypothetical protein
MKTRLIFLVLLIACFSCGTNNKPVSDAQKEKIKGEVKEAVNTFIKGCEEVNFDMAIEPFLDSPDFVYIGNGTTYSYKELMAMRPNYDALLNQKITIVDEKYAVLDNSTVIYSLDSKCATNYRDDHSALYDPDAVLFIFKKINSRWRVVYYVDSYVEKNVLSESLKKLNQVELLKKFVGSWKCDIAKDTTFFWDTKSYVTGLECYFKIVTKGKIVTEGRQLWGYDKNLDRCIAAEVVKGMDMMIYAVQFISNNKFKGLLYNEIPNPEKASPKFEGEFTSPDMYVETTIINNKTVKTDIYTRIK